MSSFMLVRAWEVRNITPSERLVLLALADCADREGRNAFKAQSTIADHTQLDIRTVRRAMTSLEARGLIAVQELPTNRRATTYYLFPSESGHYARSDSGHPGQSGAGITPGLGRTSERARERANPPNPPTPPYKDDPVDPVDPGLLSLLTKTVEHYLAQNPTLATTQLHDTVRRYIAARGWPISDAVVDRVITQRKAESA